MELYDRVCAGLSKQLTEQYSTSFTAASRLFPDAIRHHIYNIYGLVRIADEIVDTYQGSDREEQLDNLEQETYEAISRGFSVNPLVHSFATTARSYKIDRDLIQPFFKSMRMDLRTVRYDKALYDQYIYGSAEVIGLMCLRVFCAADSTSYRQLEPGARRLGAAYQKVNFLRDIGTDYHELGRMYFPGVTFDTFDEDAKKRVIDDIKDDFTVARSYIDSLPVGARTAVEVSYRYYFELLSKLSIIPIADIKQQRVRLPNYKKALILAPYMMRIRR